MLSFLPFSITTVPTLIAFNYRTGSGSDLAVATHSIAFTLTLSLANDATALAPFR